MKTLHSLKKNYQFRMVYQKARSLACKNIVMYVMKNDLQLNRLGITVSKKVGNAVVRNRIRRYVKENMRLLEKNSSMHQGFDIVIIARIAASQNNFHEIKHSILFLLKKHGVFKAEEE